eukprot:2370693-Amphidinium_carterae.1
MDTAVTSITGDVASDIIQTRKNEFGVVKAIQALQTGRRTAKGRNRDLEKRAVNVLLPGQHVKWMKAHLKKEDVDSGRITANDLHGNKQVDVLANEGTAAHGPLEPNANWLSWADFANRVYHFWRLVGPQLRERPDNEPRVRLPAEEVMETPAVGPKGMVFPEAPFQIGPDQRVVRRAAMSQL